MYPKEIHVAKKAYKKENTCHSTTKSNKLDHNIHTDSSKRKHRVTSFFIIQTMRQPQQKQIEMKRKRNSIGCCIFYVIGSERRVYAIPSGGIKYSSFLFGHGLGTMLCQNWNTALSRVFACVCVSCHWVKRLVLLIKLLALIAISFAVIKVSSVNLMSIKTQRKVILKKILQWK